MNKTNTIQFLECYERHPCLWNPDELHYRNKLIRTSALKSIIQEMGLDITVAEIKLKIKNIRTTYNREARKVAESIKKGHVLYTPQLIWFSVADRFLKPVIEERKEKEERNEREEEKEEREKMVKKERKDSAADTNSDESSSGQDTFIEHVQKKQKLTPKKKVERALNIDPLKMEPPTDYLEIIDTPNMNPPVSQEVNNFGQDEFDIFGLHVASQLRSLPLTNAITCQNFINNYLSQERLKILNAQHPPISRPTSSTSEDH